MDKNELKEKVAGLRGEFDRLEKEVVRFVDGNVKVAGTRARNAIQDMKTSLQDIRVAILTISKVPATPAPTTNTTPAAPAASGKDAGAKTAAPAKA